MRISIGTREEMEQLFAFLKDICAGLLNSYKINEKIGEMYDTVISTRNY